MAIEHKLKWKWALLQVALCTVWAGSYSMEGTKAAYIMIGCLVGMFYVLGKWERWKPRKSNEF